MSVYLDEHKQGKMEKIGWLKQYAMIIIACCRQKFRNQNWRYGYRNNHFGLNANFCGLFFHIFQGPSRFQDISGTLSGVSTISVVFQVFRGFRGCSPPWYVMVFLEHSEAATGGVLYQKKSLEISLNSQENTCATVPILIQLQAWGL